MVLRFFSARQIGWPVKSQIMNLLVDSVPSRATFESVGWNARRLLESATLNHKGTPRTLCRRCCTNTSTCWVDTPSQCRTRWPKVNRDPYATPKTPTHESLTRFSVPLRLKPQHRALERMGDTSTPLSCGGSL